ncbi:unnamed protein product [Heterosigma akashiwo]
MRKVISKRLTESKATVPHSYLAMEVELDALLALRKELAAQEVKVSVNDVVIRASGLALRDCPAVNSKWDGKQKVPGGSVDISIAVATPSGLITPIVPDVDRKGLVAITDKVRDLAGPCEQAGPGGVHGGPSPSATWACSHRRVQRGGQPPAGRHPRRGRRRPQGAAW